MNIKRLGDTEEDEYRDAHTVCDRENSPRSKGEGDGLVIGRTTKD